MKPCERMSYLLKSGHLSDCSFALFEEDGSKVVVKCHKFVLMSASPVFERMFEGDFDEARLSENIVLDDVSAPDFRKFIEYVYWNDNDLLQKISLETTRSLVYLSKKFMVTSMTSACMDSLRLRLADLKPDEVIDMYEYAHQLGDLILISSVQTLFITNPHKYIDRQEVFDLSNEVFLKFIKFYQGFVTEKVRFCLIERYCQMKGMIKPSLKIFKQFKIKTDNENGNEDENSPKKKKEDSRNSSIEEDIEYVSDILTKRLSISNENNNTTADNQVTSASSQQEESKKIKNKKNLEYIQKLLETIKFTSMSAIEFCSGPGMSNLMTDTQKYDILSRICLTNDFSPKPKQSHHSRNSHSFRFY